MMSVKHKRPVYLLWIGIWLWVIAGLLSSGVAAGPPYEETPLLPKYQYELEGRSSTVFFDEDRLSQHILRKPSKEDKLFYKRPGAGEGNYEPLTTTAKQTIYVMDSLGRFYIYEDPPMGEIHHSSFLRGQPVASAGVLKARDGKVTYIDNASGHYQPDQAHLLQALDELQRHNLLNPGVKANNLFPFRLQPIVPDDPRWRRRVNDNEWKAKAGDTVEIHYMRNFLNPDVVRYNVKYVEGEKYLGNKGPARTFLPENRQASNTFIIKNDAPVGARIKIKFEPIWEMLDKGNPRISFDRGFPQDHEFTISIVEGSSSKEPPEEDDSKKQKEPLKELMEAAGKDAQLPAAEQPLLLGKADGKGYAGLYLNMGYEKASEALALPPSSVPPEGYALLPSKTVIDAVEEKRNFEVVISEEIRVKNFRVGDVLSKPGDKLKETVVDLREIKNKVKALKEKEWAAIDEAFGKFVSTLTPETQKRIISARALFDEFKKKGKKFKPLLDSLAQAKSFGDAAVAYYEKGAKGLLQVIAQKGCTSLFSHLNDALVLAGSSSGGVVGGYVAERGGKILENQVCNVMLPALFLPSTGQSWLRDIYVYSEDPVVDKYVKVFYTGDIVEATLPLDINFFGRYGGSRESILKQFKTQDRLNKALNRHILELRKRQPRLRPFLDVDKEAKAKTIWKLIIETANKDMAQAISNELESTDKPQRPYVEDLQKYSWLFGPSGDRERPVKSPPIIIKELPKDIGEVAVGETVDVVTRFMVLGVAGNDETVNVEWGIRGAGLDGKAQKTKEFHFDFPEDRVREKDLLRIGVETFSFKVDKASFIPGGKYAVYVNFKDLPPEQAEIVIPFQVKNGGKKAEGPAKVKEGPEGLDKLGGISGRATATAAQIDALCKSAREKAEKAKAELENLKKETDKIRGKIKAVKEKIAKLSEKVQKAQAHKDEAYKAGEKVVEAKQKMETLLSQLCKNADAVKSADSGNVPRLLSEIDKANETIGKLRQEAEREARKSKDEARKAEALYNETNSIPAEIEGLKITISGLQGRLESVQKATREVREAAGKVKEKVSELESIYGEAAALLKDAKNKLEPIKETDKAKEVTKSMEGAVGVIAPAVERAKKCPEEFKTTLESLDKALSGIEGDFKSSKAEIEAMALSAAVQESIAKIQDFAKKAKESADAAEVYLTWVEKYGIDAVQCVRTAKEDAARASDQSHNDAKSALQACDFREARRLIDKVAAGPKRTQLEQEYTQSNSHEEKTQALFQEANNQYKSCNFDGALAKLNQALNHTRCEKYRTSLRDKIAAAKQAKGHEDKTKSLFQEANTSYKGCNFEDAEAKLQEALRNTTCDKNRDSLREKVTVVKKAKEHEARTASLSQEADNLSQDCYFDESLSKLNEALNHTRCDRYKGSLNGKIGAVQKAKTYEDTTKALFQQANASYKQGNLKEALGLLLKAQNHTKCERLRSSLGQKIAQVQAELEKGKRPPPIEPLPPPSVEPPPTSDARHFYVVFQVHLPMPKQLPEWTKQKPPANADEATRKRFSEEKKKRLEVYVNSLTLGNTVIQSVEPQKWALSIHIDGSALSTYPRKIFMRGEKFSLPYRGRGKDQQGNPFDIDAAFLLTVAETFDSLERSRAAYPSLKQKDSTVLEINNSSGTMNYQDPKGSARVGPLTRGWTNENMQKSLVMTKMLLAMFGGDCFIATAVYGDVLAPELDVLRKFRDTVLVTTEEGIRLVNAYYKYGPILAAKVKNHSGVIPVLRFMLDGLVHALQERDLNKPVTKTIINTIITVVDKIFSQFMYSENDNGLILSPGSLSFRDFNQQYQDGRTGDETCIGKNENTKR